MQTTTNGIKRFIMVAVVLMLPIAQSFNVGSILEQMIFVQQ